jgi:hypothetical protein
MRWWAPAVALFLAQLACAAPATSRGLGKAARLAVASELWFSAIFELTNPLEGGELRFVNDHLGFTESSVNYGVPLRGATITFVPVDISDGSRLSESQWNSHLPLTFNAAGFSGSLSWNAASELPGGITQTREGGLLVTVGTRGNRKRRVQ